MSEPDAQQLVDGDGSFNYLARSIAIVTLLYERGILQELIESGRITEEEVAQRTELIVKKYPEFSRDQTQDKDAGAEQPGE